LSGNKITREAPHAPAPARWIDRLPPILIAGLAALLAGLIYRQFLDSARFLWDELGRDRSAHYLAGLRLAIDLRHLDLLQFLADLEQARVWPPLHGLLVAPVLLVGGLDYRLAVLPSLAAWAATAVVLYLLASTMCRHGGWLAGPIAAAFFMASPAHALLAVDIMLESLGALLTVLALLAYVRFVQQRTRRRTRFLALALTLLFLCKYNYYVLVAVGLLACEVVGRPGAIWNFARRHATASTVSRFVWRQAHHPLTYVLLILAGLLVYVSLHGGGTYHICNMDVSVRSPLSLLYPLYLVLCLRLLLAAAQRRRAHNAPLPPNVATFARWHLLPVAIWFALPQRLAAFAYYVSPANTAVHEGGLWDAVQFYTQALATEYHLGTWSCVLSLGLFLVATLSPRALRPGGHAVLTFVILAAQLTLLHPHRQGRFAHTWLAALWAGAGAGAAWLLVGVRPSFALRFRTFAATLCAIAFGAVQLSGAYVPAGLRGLSPAYKVSMLEIPESYLADLRDAQRVALFATLPIQYDAEWPYLERYPDRPRLETFLRGFSTDVEQNRRLFERWLARTPADTIVFVDVHREQTFHYGRYAHYAQYRDLLAMQDQFVRVSRHALPHLQCETSVWKRR
jgi:hypothetical protein